MHLYRQTIVLFGIILPIVVALVIVGVCYAVKSNMAESFEIKEKGFKDYELSRVQSLELEAQVARQREHLARWNEQLSKETASTVAASLRDIIEHLPSKEIIQTAFERPGGNAGIGSATAQKSSQIRIAFRGTFRTLQRAFLELETRMPQLQLQDLRIDPPSGQSSLINFQVTYTAWEN